MGRRGSTENYKPKSAEELEAEQAGKAALRDYFAKTRGRQAEVSRKTRIFPPILCKMATKPDYTINLEYALLIEVATDGAIRADQLCPSRAGLLSDVVRLRSGANATAA